MATRTDTLKIRLTTDGEGRVKASLAGVSDEMHEVDASTQRVERSAISLRGVLGAVATGAAVAFAKRQLDIADSLDGVSRRLGVNVETLQEYRHAAKESSVEIGTFDMSLQRFTRRAAEAANGTGEAKGALEELGITLRDNEGNIRDTDDLLLDVADAMQQVPTHADKMRLAFKLFDSEGVSMLNMLERGSEGINEFRQQARDTGLVMDEALVQQAAAASREVERMGEVISMKATVAVAELAPEITALTDAIVELITPGTELHDLASKLAPAITGLLAANLLGPAFARAGAGAMTFASGLATATGRATAMRGVMSVLGGPGGLIIGAATALSTWALTSRNARADTGDLVDEVDRLLGKFDELERREVNKAIEDLETAIEAQRRKVIAVFDTARRFGRDGDSMLAWEKEAAMEAQDELDELIGKYNELKAKREEIENRGQGDATPPGGRRRDAGGAESIEGGGDDEDPLAIYAAGFDEALRARTERLVESLRTEEEAERASYQQRVLDLEDAYVSGIIPTEEAYQEQLEALERQHQERLTEIQGEGTNARVDNEREAQSLIQSMQNATWSHALGLMRSLAGESKSWAIATIAVGKGLAMAEAQMNTAVAVTKALTVDPTGALAARVRMMGYAQMALIGATGVLQASQVGSGGAAAGSPANPVHTTSGDTAPGIRQEQDAPRGGLTIQYLGDVYGLDDFGESVSRVLRDRINDSDDVLITRNSRQARELGVG